MEKPKKLIRMPQIEKDLNKSEAAIRGWITRRQRYGPTGRRYWKRGRIHRRRTVKK